MAASAWFSATLVFESRVAGTASARPLCEERVVLFAAADLAAARAAATAYGLLQQHSYPNRVQEEVAWTFVGIEGIVELDTMPETAGWEVASRFVRRHRRAIDRMNK